MISNEAAESLVNQMEEFVTELLGKFDLYAFVEFGLRWLRENEKYLDNLRSRQTLMEAVKNSPDEFEATIPIVMGLFKAAPAIIRQEIMQISHDIARRNPIRAGRPRVIKSREEEREVVVAVGQLLIDGCSLGEAQKRIAKRRNASLRTVQAIWRRRKNIDKLEPRTIPELLDAFSALEKEI
jgi:hypothetical protein